MRTWRLTRRGRDLLVAVGCVWLGYSVVTQLAFGYGTLSFYIGHGLELGGVALIAIPAALDLARGGPSRPLVGDLAAPELVASEEAFLGPRVRSLVQQLTERDDSVAEHTRRVALLAARVGEELKLPAATRRDLAVGGLLHDIGKLSVPLEILRKPSALTDDEYTEIKRHPGNGRRLLEELGGFSPAVRDLVSDHHERLDGTGYPRGLSADRLPLPVRILTVCDVYDALVSDRVYRAAWTSERAFALLRADAGDAFCAECVEALSRVLEHEVDPRWVADLERGRVPYSAPARRRYSAEADRAPRQEAVGGDDLLDDGVRHRPVRADRHHRHVGAAAVLPGGWRPTAASEMLTPWAPKQVPTRPIMPGTSE